MSEHEITYSDNGVGLLAKDLKGKLVGKSPEEPVKSLNIAVFGASGGTGLEVVKEALKRGHKSNIVYYLILIII